MTIQERHGIRVLLVGTYVTHAHNHSVGEDLGMRLRESGWHVLMTSYATNRYVRPIDMATTVWRERRQYDVAQVDVYSGDAFLWAEAACFLLRRIHKPYVLSLHGGNLPSFAKQFPRRVRKLLNSAAVVTTPSRYLLEELTPYRHDLNLVPNPVDLASYVFILRESASPRLVWLRAFHKIYNPELAPEVVARLRPEFPGLSLVMVGPDKDGSLSRTLERAEELGVRDAIDIPGGVSHDDVPTWLQRGDIFINTTNVDNTPVSVLEAMACGLPVVSTNVGGIPYLLEDEQDALLVPPADPEAMALAIRRVLTLPELAERLSRAGRQAVEAMSWEVVQPLWEHILREAVSEYD